MKTSIYNIGATALLIFGIYSYNILSMDEQKEANGDIAYPFSVENVEAFAKFCLESGGFSIY